MPPDGKPSLGSHPLSWRPMNDLAQALRDPGFTPGKRHVGPLLDLIAGPDEDQAIAAERALLRVGPSLEPTVFSRLQAATPPGRARLARLLGRLATQPGGAPLVDRMVALLGDPDAKTRRNAILALGKLPRPDIEGALLALWKPETPVEHLRSLADSLGKVGGARSLEVLRAVQSTDAELIRLAGRASVMLARTVEQTPSTIDDDALSPGTVQVVLHCRAGLEGIMLQEANGAIQSARVVGPGVVRGQLAGSLRRVQQVRTMLYPSFPLPPAPIGPGGVAEALVAVLHGREATALFDAWARGPVRFRIDWDRGGHQRALVWQIARLVDQRGSRLINDPSEAPWEVGVHEREGRLFVDLRPRIDDRRFAYRVADVPAASHPTVAAALAIVGGVRPDDVVWDPFVGSGMELCERARLGPYAALHGSDINEAAIEGALANLRSSGVEPRSMLQADARKHRVPGVTLIITNPPMGRRVERHADLDKLLSEFVRNAAYTLVPGGRLVWLSPMGDRTARFGQAEGLVVERRGPVDLGGLPTELQVMRKPAASPDHDDRED
jgi:predicted RNA methylase